MMSQTGAQLSRSRSRSSDHNERLEPRLLRAAESDDVDLLRQIIDAAKVKKQLNDNFLQIGLRRSAEKGKINATRFLLARGARPDGGAGNRLSPLLLAVEKNNIAIVQLLLEHGANTEAADKKGYNALMTAAWKNHWHILNSLIAKGANINAKDERGRNVLHNLAADIKCDWGDSVIELLLKQNLLEIDGEEGQDKLGRTPLMWACATGKLRLAEQLLNRPKGLKADVKAVDSRGKTCLHLAADHSRDDIVDMLLKHGADFHAKSDGGWTPLHNSCEAGCLKMVKILVAAGSDYNAKLLNGMTPLHLAAQYGHLELVRFLLEQKGIKRATRDAFGSTAFLRAAQKKHKDIVNLLAPFNHLDTLSEDALGACNGFSATIVDFGNFHNGNRVSRWSVYELLYGRDSVNPRKQKQTILSSDKATNFRWIHLPANNMAWMEVLLTKLFIEEGANDVEGFKGLERSFSHQHRGQQSHSHFMRPICQSSPRAPRAKQEERVPLEAAAEQTTPTITINGAQDSSEYPKTPSRSPTFRSEDSTDLLKQEKGKRSPAKGSKSPKGSETPKGGKPFRGNENSKGLESPKGLQTTIHHSHRPHSPASERKDLAQMKGNVFTFMPYLHFESTERCQEMQRAIKKAESLRSLHSPYLSKATTYDEMLIRAHLANSTHSLHIRRTLDQSFYHNINTESRDQDQVVYRYQLHTHERRNQSLEDPGIVDPKIVMVDQLWMWVLGKDLIVTSFPQRWQQPKNDPLNVLDSIIEDINSRTREPVRSVHDLSMIITNRCTGVFNRSRMSEDDYQFLDMFESSIGNATDRETVLFKEFNLASAQASAWLQQHQRPNRFSKYLDFDDIDTESTRELHTQENEGNEEKFKYEVEEVRGPLFVDKLLDIGQEIDLLAETKDIRDELNMIAKVLEDQLQVLPDLQEAIVDLYKDENVSQVDIKKRFREQTKTIEMHIKDIDRMDRQAERIYKSITDMLDLKQKHANAFEARFARDQAAGTARQSQTIMVFTIVTIIFLPLSFIAAFFAIPIRQFPHESQNPSLPLRYVSQYMFGISFAVSIPLIAIALSLDDIAQFFRHAKRWILKPRKGNDEAPAPNTLEMLRIEQAISMARSARKSLDTEWMRGRVSLGARPPTRDEQASIRNERIGRAPTGFRMRPSVDIERGDVREQKRK